MKLPTYFLWRCGICGAIPPALHLHDMVHRHRDISTSTNLSLAKPSFIHIRWLFVVCVDERPRLRTLYLYGAEWKTPTNEEVTDVERIYGLVVPSRNEVYQNNRSSYVSSNRGPPKCKTLALTNRPHICITSARKGLFLRAYPIPFCVRYNLPLQFLCLSFTLQRVSPYCLDSVFRQLNPLKTKLF
jgi:hypothetical protein